MSMAEMTLEQRHRAAWELIREKSAEIETLRAALGLAGTTLVYVREASDCEASRKAAAETIAEIQKESTNGGEADAC